jgi:hypothetical protein
MPRKDGSGPDGKGPMTGRGLGKCNPNNINKNEDTTNFGLRNGNGRRLGGRFK